MGPVCGNPAFSRAIPQDTLIVDSLNELFFCGSFGESRNGLIWGYENCFMLGPNVDPLWDRT